jgi:hypothetical protein
MLCTKLGRGKNTVTRNSSGWAASPSITTDNPKGFTQYATGALKETKGKRMYQLVPKQMVDALADVLTYGALTKYKDNNWRLGQPFTEIMRAAEGHFLHFKDCEDMDKASGLAHLEQAFTNLGFIITHIRCGRTDLDDRYNWRKGAK